MTLILTCMTPEWVVQVCDSRISYGSSGKAPLDSARKLLFYIGHGAQLSIAYTGFATVEEAGRSPRPLNAWLADVAPDIAAQAGNVPAFALSLMEALDSITESKRINDPESDCRLSIVMAGFVDSTAAAGAICLSNFQRGGFRLPLDPTVDPLPVPVSVNAEHKVGSFEYSVVTKPTGLGLLIHGDHNLLRPPISSELQAGLQNSSEASDPLTVREILVAALSRVAEMNPNGSVSADCWSRVVWRDGRPELFQSHFADPAKQSLNPTLIGRGLRIDSVLVSHEPTTAVECAREKLAKGLLGQRLDGPTLIAFLDWSPRIEALANVVENCGVTITPPGYIDDLTKLVEQSGYMYVRTLEAHIASAGAWADEMAKEVTRRQRPSEGLGEHYARKEVQESSRTASRFPFGRFPRRWSNGFRHRRKQIPTRGENALQARMGTHPSHSYSHGLRQEITGPHTVERVGCPTTAGRKFNDSK